MEFSGLPVAFVLVAILGLSYLVLILAFSWWVWPILTLRKLKRCGFGGPTPSFPLGNIKEMKKKNNSNVTDSSSLVSSEPNHDIHSTVFPYFSRWQNSHGKLAGLLII